MSNAMHLLLLFATFVFATATSLLAQSVETMPGWERTLLQVYENQLMQSLSDTSHGCVDCHSNEGTSSLILSGDPLEDFRRLLDDGYLETSGPDTILTRVTSSNMPTVPIVFEPDPLRIGPHPPEIRWNCLHPTPNSRQPFQSPQSLVCNRLL